MAEIQSATNVAYLLAEIVRKVARFPERVQVRMDVEDGTTVLQLCASPTDLRAIRDDDGRMARSLELVAYALGKRDGEIFRLIFLEETKH